MTPPLAARTKQKKTDGDLNARVSQCSNVNAFILLSYMHLGRLISASASEPVWLWLNLLGGASMSVWAGPLKRSRKESGRSASSFKLFCAHSLRVITILTILKTDIQILKFIILHASETFENALEIRRSKYIHTYRPKNKTVFGDFTACLPGHSASSAKGILGIDIPSVNGCHSLELRRSVITHGLGSSYINPRTNKK